MKYRAFFNLMMFITETLAHECAITNEIIVINSRHIRRKVISSDFANKRIPTCCFNTIHTSTAKCKRLEQLAAIAPSLISISKHKVHVLYSKYISSHPVTFYGQLLHLYFLQQSQCSARIKNTI